jgi:uncharacterized repeat protein (TIGR01451 family)
MRMQRLFFFALCLLSIQLLRPEIGAAANKKVVAPRPAPASGLYVRYTFDSGGCSAQGWTTNDNTAQLDNYFHVEDFSGMGSNYQGHVGVLAGTKSLWCGAKPSASPTYCSYAALPGYGNNWNQAFCLNGCRTFSSGGTVTFLADWDTEPNYDALTVEYTNDCAGNVGWTVLDGGPGVWDGDRTDTSLISVSIPASPQFAALRLHFTSGPYGSDEDGGYDGDGVAIDNLAVTGVPTEDFEGEALGAINANDWHSCVQPGFGNYAALFSGSAIQASSPTNLSCMWAFINGSTEFYSCGAPPRPSQKVVPHINARGQYIDNEIRSPEIPLTGVGTSLYLSFDVYHDLPTDNVVYYFWKVRYKITGCWSRWLDDGPTALYNGDEDKWVTRNFDIGHLCPVPLSSATDVQVALGVKDMCRQWCGTVGTGLCHSFAPLFDNVVVTDGADLCTVSGRVYGDVAGNCAYDAGTDTPVGQRLIEASPGGYVSSTQPDGTYSFFLPAGAYQIAQRSIPNDPYKVTPCQASSYSVNATANGNISGKDFALYPTGLISGKVYVDFPADCSFNGSDFPLAGRPITILPEGYTALTDASGNYKVRVPVGSHTVTQGVIVNDPYTTVPCQPASIGVIVSPNGNASGKNFALQGSGPPHCDASISIYWHSYVAPPGPCGNRVANGPCPGIPNMYFFTIRNATTATLAIPVGTTVDLSLATQFTIQSVACEQPITVVAAPAPNLRTVRLDSAVNPGQTQVITVIATPASSATYVTQMTLNDPSGCAGTKTASNTTKDNCSCDPNDNAVQPAGCGPEGNIPGNQRLTYTIHFENVGPGAAHNIVVNEDLDADLVPNSVTVLASSHPVTGVQIDPGSVLAIEFEGIELPGTYDSGNNNGWVVFSIDMQPSLADGTTIESTAAVTFDYNDPVITNTVVNTISSGPCPTGVDSPTLPVANYLGLNHPNPFNPTTTIEYGLVSQQHVELSIFDVHGQLIKTLVNETKPAGWYDAEWDGRDRKGNPVASGVYLSRMAAGSFSDTRKLVLLK